MIKKQLLKLFAKYALSITESISISKEEKFEIVDTCNKISELTWVLAKVAKGKDFGEYNNKIIADQLKDWSEGKPTLKSFKSIYR